MESKKSNKIRDIVVLQQILKKWRKVANASKSNRCNSNSSSSSNSNSNSNSNNGSRSIKFLKRTLSLSDNSIVGEASSNTVIPKGYLAVSVGEEQKRFIMPTEYLSHNAFQILLREAEEEFGFQQTGILRIPCQVPIFEHILKMVEQNKDSFFLQESLGLGYCASESQRTPSHHPQSPMCR